VNGAFDTRTVNASCKRRRGRRRRRGIEVRLPKQREEIKV
jgi:hypothetical protein